ncbi:hypothetical protein A6X21_05085 [Planctopirus hydrillae]|uniref:Uncharacterized protein n=1 Tax=Planctopirus hydrillae TaxID=1841610 RepID=A0A1C3EIS3_9PLAN|nr:hypothetical protein A6X21_05085 [Planctopirus hydrillae]
MKRYLIDGDSIEFRPDAGWNFDGFDGRVAVKAEARCLLVGGRPIVVAEDLVACASEILQKAYKAQGFDKVPGAIIRAEVSVDEQSLCELLTCDGKKAATEATEGTFSITCRPSLSGSSPPLPDPGALRRTGKWSVAKTFQNFFDRR